MLSRRQFTTGLTGSLAIIAAAPRSAAAAADPRPSRRGEAAELRAFAEKTHPRGREAAADAQWRSRWAALESSADRIPDGSYFIAMRRALGWFGDGHTTLLPFEFTGGVPDAMKSGPFGLGLPLQARIFHDGVFITASNAAHRPLLGTRIDRAGTLSTAEIIRAAAVDWPGNKAWAHRWAAMPFASPALLQGLGAIADPNAPVRFAVTAAGGARIADIVPAAGPLRNRLELEWTASPREGWAEAAGGGNYVRALPERRAIYISIDEMGDIKGRSFEQLTRESFAALGAAEIERVILDLRRNGGGNNFLGEALRKRLENSRFNRPGGLYVLIGPQTFSAAQNLANRIERETFALFVGEPTGGAPNHYGDAQIWQGKATGITAIVSTLPWFDSYPQDKRPWIMPDLPVPARFEDWLSGRDPALEAALTHRPQQPIDELSRESIFYYSRASQAAEWKPFWA